MGCASSAAESSPPATPMTSSGEHQAASEDPKKKKKKTKTQNQDTASNEVMGDGPSEPVANSSRCEAEKQSSQVIVEAHIEAIPVQKDDEATRRRFEQQLQTKDDEILSLRTAIRDRDNEMKRFDNAWKDLQKELSTSRDEVARTKAELEAAKAVKVAQVTPVQKDDEATRRQLQTKDDEILSLRTAIKDRDHELKVLSEEIARTKADLEAAKEEIAVKVAQVKQYQKQVEAYKQQVHVQDQFEQPYNQEKETNARLKEEIDLLKKSLAQSTQASSARRDKQRSVSDVYHKDPPTLQSQNRHGSLASKASTERAHSHVSHDSDDDLPEPVIMHYPTSPAGHLPSDARPIPRPVAAGQYHNVEADGATSLGDLHIPLDPNLTCLKCRRQYRKGEIQLYKQHVELCQISEIL